uniref:COesterase domain-containing protein n=1 Tax=Caenorhabditis japonica TaxID=281687 RepID=A0A8R1DHE2_CAEJA
MRPRLGFGNDVTCESFAENFVNEGIIVVNIQYRVAALGFLTLGCSDPRIPCNIGLWDMLTAFQFVNRTISDFGGNAQDMTAWGHSAGAMAVGLHSMSPISSKFFNNFIAMSASAWPVSRYRHQNWVQSRKILQGLKCNLSDTDSNSIFECVNGTSLDDLYTAQIDTHLWPEFGDALLPDIPEKMVRENTKNQRLLTGLMTLESLYFTYLKSSPEIFPFIHRDTVEEYINSSFAVQYGIDSIGAYTALLDYYLASNVSDSAFPYFMRQRTKIDSNTGFDIPVLREVNARLSESPFVYLYYFPYFNPAQFDANFPVKATYHCHEFPYVWGLYKDNFYELNDEDEKVAKFLQNALVNFIKTGNPSSGNFTWPPADASMTHTVIQPEPTIGKDLFKSDYDFWDSMAKKFQLDIITGLPAATIETTTKNYTTHKSVLLLAIIISLIIA